MKVSVMCVLLCLVGFTMEQKCRLWDSEDGIQTGKISLNAQNTGTQSIPNYPRVRTYEVPIRFPINNRELHVAVSANHISHTNEGYDFKLSNGRGNNQNSIMMALFTDSPSSWINVDVSYLVSSYEGLIAGSIIGDPFVTSQIIPSEEMLYKVSGNFQGPSEATEANYTIAVFISGLRTPNSKFTLSFSKDNIQIRNGIISMVYFSNANPGFEFLQVTYIAFNKTDTKFILSTSDSTYQFKGVRNFIETQSMPQSFKICNQGQKCKENAFPSIDGVSCTCLAGYVEVDGKCRQLCLGNNNNYKDDSDRCICLPDFFLSNTKCIPKSSCLQTNSQYSQQQNKCICKQNYHEFEDGQCYPVQVCDENKIYSSQFYGCVCKQGYVQIDSQKCQLKKTCQLNEIFVNPNRCECAVGYTRNSDQQKCQKIPCQPNSELVGAYCQCKEGYERDAQWNCIKSDGCNKNEQLIFSNCLCIAGFARDENDTCSLNANQCRQNQFYNIISQKCQCLKTSNIIKIGEICFNKCGVNSIWQDGKCKCKQGYAKINSNCRKCPAGSIVSNDLNTCVCHNQMQIFKPSTLLCEMCPEKSVPNFLGNGCECLLGYKLEGSRCISQPLCPSGAEWNKHILRCVCVTPLFYLIDNQCQPCGQNERWNSTNCVCENNFYKIGGMCRTCHPLTVYDGNNCVCQIGYYGNWQNCYRCDPTCGTCFGSAADQCMTCVDFNYRLDNGRCIPLRADPCHSGQFYNGLSCVKCTDFCFECSDSFTCDRCAEGFEKSVQNIDGQNMTICEGICGDGLKRHFEMCDDANTQNADGCSDHCTIESGWICATNSSTAPSECTKKIPTSSVIKLKGIVNLFDRVVQSVTLSYVPTCFTENDCIQCDKILDVKIIQASLPMFITVNYNTNREGQFLIQFDFNGIQGTEAFTFTVQINKNLPSQYKNCFTLLDYQQKIKKTVDPATLAVINERGRLGQEIWGLSGPNRIHLSSRAFRFINSQ